MSNNKIKINLSALKSALSATNNTQRAIGEYFGIKQSAVSYRNTHGWRRADFEKLCVWLGVAHAELLQNTASINNPIGQPTLDVNLYIWDEGGFFIRIPLTTDPQCRWVQFRVNTTNGHEIRDMCPRQIKSLDVSGLSTEQIRQLPLDQLLPEQLEQLQTYVLSETQRALLRFCKDTDVKSYTKDVRELSDMELVYLSIKDLSKEQLARLQIQRLMPVAVRRLPVAKLTDAQQRMLPLEQLTPGQLREVRDVLDPFGENLRRQLQETE